MYKDLQIQILEDVADTCIGVCDYQEHFQVRHIYSDGAAITRKRPEGLLQLVEQHAYDNCISVDVCTAMGMQPTRGVLVSIGLAFKKLGWRREKTFEKGPRTAKRQQHGRWRKP